MSFMRRSNSPQGTEPSTFARLLAPVVLVAVAGILGWLLLVTIKWLIVTLLVAFGIALILVPIGGWSRIVGTTTGPVKRHRVNQLLTAIALGVALIVLGIVVSNHGWLLIVVPVVVVLVGRLIGKFSEARARRAARVG
jgi:cation transport ATPase